MFQEIYDGRAVDGNPRSNYHQVKKGGKNLFRSSMPTRKGKVSYTRPTTARGLLHDIKILLWRQYFNKRLVWFLTFWLVGLVWVFSDTFYTPEYFFGFAKGGAIKGISGRPCLRCDKTANTVHVLIVGKNQGAELLQEAVASVLNQNYDRERLFVWVYDDGSDDLETLAALEKVCDEKFETLVRDGGGKHGLDVLNFSGETGQAVAGGVKCLRGESLGPAAAKFIAFRRIGGEVGPNDVILVVDGDDELNTNDALIIINRKYIDDGVWCTYGSYSGKWNEQTKDIENRTELSALGSTRKYRPREEEPKTSWRYGHPRSFKAHLTKHMTEEDFTDAEGNWLMKATDRGFVYRMLELSGASRVGYIENQVYKYKFSSKSSTLATVPEEVRKANLGHVLALNPSDPLRLPMHVVFVLWDRILLLPEQLVNLQEQANSLYAKTGRPLRLHLVNNNAKHVGLVDKIVEDFCVANIWGGWCDNHHLNFSITVSHQVENWHAYARFLYVAMLRRTVPIDNVIFIDDDQLWPGDYILSMAESYAPKTSSHWYGKIFLESKTKLVDYWATSINMDGIRAKERMDIARWRYGGPGGSIYSTDLWLYDKELFRLSDDLVRFHDYDDIWVSYIMDHKLGWEMRRYFGPQPYDADRDEAWTKAHTEDEISRLRNVGTYILAGQNNHIKTDFLNYLQQRPFNWQVLGSFEMTKL